MGGVGCFEDVVYSDLNFKRVAKKSPWHSYRYFITGLYVNFEAVRCDIVSYSNSATISATGLPRPN